MIGRNDVEKIGKNTDAVVQMAGKELDHILALAKNLDPADARNLLLEMMPPLVDKYGDVTATLAAEWFEELKERETGSAETALLADLQSLETIQADVRREAAPLFDGDFDGFKVAMNELLSNHLWYMQRETVARNIAGDPRCRIARVPRGPNPCGWCKMLASRGWVYHSKDSAGDKKGSRGEYHDKDKCQPVPYWDRKKVFIAGYKPDEWYAEYKEALDQLPDGASGSEIALQMDKNDRAKAAIAAGREPGKRGRPPSAVTEKVARFSPMVFADDKAAVEWANTYISPVTDAAEGWEIARAYSGKYHRDLNRALRESGGDWSVIPDAMLKEIRTLESFIGKTSTPKDIVLFRGTNWAEIQLPDGTRSTILSKKQIQSLEGTVQTAHSFTSTAIGSSVFSAAPLEIRFQAKAGTNLANLMKVSIYEEAEREMLLKPGVQYRIEKIFMENDRWVIDAVLL